MCMYWATLEASCTDLPPSESPGQHSFDAARRAYAVAPQASVSPHQAPPPGNDARFGPPQLEIIRTNDECTRNRDLFPGLFIV